MRRVFITTIAIAAVALCYFGVADASGDNSNVVTRDPAGANLRVNGSDGVPFVGDATKGARPMSTATTTTLPGTVNVPGTLSTAASSNFVTCTGTATAIRVPAFAFGNASTGTHFCCLLPASVNGVAGGAGTATNTAALNGSTATVPYIRSRRDPTKGIANTHTAGSEFCATYDGTVLQDDDE